MEEAVVLSAVRTPIGSFLGSLKDVPSPRLGAAAAREAVRRSGLAPGSVDEALFGCVLPAGLGQAPARQAVIFADLPNSIRCTTLNRVCASGLKAVMVGAQMIQTGDCSAVLAGGMESMSRAPFILEKAREGLRLGHARMIDSVVHDGLWDVYNDIHMGECAELCARERKISRQTQDEHARASYTRALESIRSGKFRDEIVGVPVTAGKETRLVDTDEEPGRGKLEKFGDLRPSFQKDGSVTVANASSLSDGAAALVLASSKAAKTAGAKPIARILAQASHAQAPEWFTTAPVGAVRTLLAKAGLKPSDIDLYELNEAFSVVSVACARELGLDESKVNVRGGAVALGHPIGASGARILVTLLHALRAEGKRLGVAAICNGGGEASAILVEALA